MKMNYIRYGSLIFTILMMLFVPQGVLAGKVFKPLDEQSVAKVNGVNISVEELEKAKEFYSRGIHGLTKNNPPKAPLSVYIKGLIDKSLLAHERKHGGTKESLFYLYYANSFYENQVLNNYYKNAIYRKISEKNPAKRNELFREALAKMYNENKDKYEIKIHKDRLLKEALLKNPDLHQIIASVDDYNIPLLDVVNSTSENIYIHLNPAFIDQKIYESVLDKLLQRAVSYKIALSLGYKKAETGMPAKQEAYFIKKAYDNWKKSEIKVAEEELKEYFNINKKTLQAVHTTRKLGAIHKTSKEALEKIKERLDNGADFEEIARNESDNKTARDQAGKWEYEKEDVGYLTNPKFIDVFSELKDGEISGVTKGYGENYIIIKRFGAKFETFEELKPRIDTKVREGHFSKLLKEEIKLLAEAAEIEINTKIISEEEYNNTFK